jgi:hypothetical protein
VSLNRKGHFQGAIQGFLPLLLVVDRGSFFDIWSIFLKKFEK